MKRAIFTLIIIAGALLVLCSCTAVMTEKQLKDVAKNWCLTIRASQVVPVYPLTEDLQPGDVFLVQIPIQKQEQLYKKRGFLPLDQLMVRLEPLDYNNLYFDSYFKSYYSGNALDRPKPAANSQDRRFHEAPLPMAAFPSYTFDVDTSTGLRIALPVQGISMGLGLMNATSATGSITISDGMTYAIGTQDVLDCLHNWARDLNVRQLLRDVRLTTKGEVYLRVVTRVYMVGAVDISLTRKRTGGVAMDVGQAPTVHLINLLAEDTDDVTAKVEAYQKVLNELSKPMASAVPGGGLRITWASGNMVTLKEKFPRLLAIGYLGFDVPILKDGSLGPLIATRDHIDPDIAIRSVPRPETASIAWTSFFNLYSMLTMNGTSTYERELAKSMDSLFDRYKLPEDVTFFKMDLDERTDKYVTTPRGDRGGYVKDKLPGFRRLNALYGIMGDSINALEKTIRGGLMKEDGKLIQPSPTQLRSYQAKLDQQQKLQKSLEQMARQHPAVRDAMELYFGDVLHNPKEK